MRLLFFLVLFISVTLGQKSHLHEAAKKRSSRRVREALDNHVEKHSLKDLADKLAHHDEQGYTPLHVAAANDNAEGARLMLSKGANLKALTKDEDQLTPLQVAAATGHTRVLDLLLSRGANIEAVNPEQETSLHLAAYFGHGYVVHHLMKAGANVNAVSSTGNTPLSYACTRGYDRPIKFMMDYNPEMNTRNNLQETPLMAAAEKGCTKCVNEIVTRLGKNQTYDDLVGELLLETDPAGETALHRAARNGHDRVVWLLASYFMKTNKNKGAASAFYNLRNRVGQTALWLASENHWSRVMFILLQLGADTSIGSNEGVSVRAAAELKPVPEHKETKMRTLGEDEEDEWVDDEGNPRPPIHKNPAIAALDEWAETLKRKKQMEIDNARKAAEKAGKLEL